MKSHQTVLLLGLFGWGCLTPDVELGEAPPSASAGTSSTTGGTPSTTSSGTSGMISGGTPATFANAGTTNSASAGSGGAATGGAGVDPCDSLLVLPDPALQAGVDEALSLGQLTNRSEVTVLKAQSVSSLEGLECLPQLTEISVFTSTADLSPLARLHQLERVYIWESEVENLEFLRSLPQLTHFALSGSGIVDLSPLSSLASLEQLHLRENAEPGLRRRSPIRSSRTAAGLPSRGTTEADRFHGGLLAIHRASRV